MKYLLFLFWIFIANAQSNFTRKDSLRGGLRAERTCFNVLKYNLSININPKQKFIFGNNEIVFKVIEKTKQIQLDLFGNMLVDSIVFESKKLKYKREFDAVFIEFPSELLVGSEQKLKFYYSGNPKIAKNAPWNGGFVYTKSASGNDWIGVACQGDGASLWYPCKDSQTDEPDFGATIKISVPSGLTAVSNGKLIEKNIDKNGLSYFIWEVKNPINTYNITLNIGDYVRFGEKYKGLDLEYYVLRENLEKAKKQFEQAKPMLDCFQEKFGEYPFKNDGYKLVETPYLGMEHQSAVAYGNGYQNGYLGRDLSGTGVGMLFDYILIHESGHEWFGNSITSKDVADMWIHEGFTCYTESVFVECQFGYKKGQTYINGLKKNIQNDLPIIGQYGVSNEGSSDMYYKGALMLNTIRHIINDDLKWWRILYKFSTTFRHQNIDSKIVIDFFNQEANLNLTKVFNAYLLHKDIPVLNIISKNNQLQYQLYSKESNLELPIELLINNKIEKITASNTLQILNLKKLKRKNWSVNQDKILFKMIIK